MPSIRRGTVSTEASVKGDETLLIGGYNSLQTVKGVDKVPLLGDIPLVGQFFRTSGRTRSKRELVIMVTPKVINDESGGVYGYGYQPASMPARQWLGQGAS